MCEAGCSLKVDILILVVRCLSDRRSQTLELLHLLSALLLRLLQSLLLLNVQLALCQAQFDVIFADHVPKVVLAPLDFPVGYATLQFLVFLSNELICSSNKTIGVLVNEPSLVRPAHVVRIEEIGVKQGQVCSSCALTEVFKVITYSGM